MRTIASLLLALMTLIFVLTSATKFDWPWLPYLRAFSEAGMVGACADWFAVVALFRRPFGLPIPHTGLVASNKAKIGAALGRFITNNFLTVKATRERLAQVEVARWIAGWIGDAANSKRLAHSMGRFLFPLVRSLPGPELGEILGTVTQRGIALVPAAPLASRLLAIIWAHGEAQGLIERAIEVSENLLTNHRDYILRKVANRSSKWIPKWIDKRIADKVMSGLLVTLREIRDPDHPWRTELRSVVQKLVDDLANDPVMYARGEAFKAELLASPLFIQQARLLWAEVEHGLHSNLPYRAEVIAEMLDLGFAAVSKWLQADAERLARLNRWIRVMILRVLLPHRFQIGAYIERVVRDWDTTTLVNKLELQVGKDLQFIRINGTLVGGLVGLLIFIASKWIAPSP
jgi:uncharacterized membrane-anchored protein YjiN (DUF445 family)